MKRVNILVCAVFLLQGWVLAASEASLPQYVKETFAADLDRYRFGAPLSDFPELKEPDSVRETGSAHVARIRQTLENGDVRSVAFRFEEGALRSIQITLFGRVSCKEAVAAFLAVIGESDNPIKHRYKVADEDVKVVYEIHCSPEWNLVNFVKLEPRESA